MVAGSIGACLGQAGTVTGVIAQAFSILRAGLTSTSLGVGILLGLAQTERMCYNRLIHSGGGLGGAIRCAQAYAVFRTWLIAAHTTLKPT